MAPAFKGHLVLKVRGAHIRPRVLSNVGALTIRFGFCGVYYGITYLKLPNPTFFVGSYYKPQYGIYRDPAKK